MQNYLKSLKNKLLNVFFTGVCFGCEKGGKMLCENCIERILNDNKGRKHNLEKISWVHISLNYENNTLRKIFHSLKFHHNKSSSKSLALLVEEDFLNYLEKIISETNSNFEDLVFIPIPLSKKRFIERDYNQSEILIKEILKLLKEKEALDLEKNILLDFLLKIKHTIRFAEAHSKEERENLIKNVFKINEKYFGKDFERKIFIIVDDITTTGATFYEARKTLLEFGILKENIFGYALAH